MQIEEIEIEKLSEDPANARVHPERNVEAIKASLQRFGQQKPIVVGKDNVVVAGNGTLRAAKALGWPTVRCVRTKLEGADRTGFAIADNRTAELAEWDAVALKSNIAAILADDFSRLSLEHLGFSEDELKELAKEIAAPESFPEVDENLPTDYKCPKCGYVWSGGNAAVSDR